MDIELVAIIGAVVAFLVMVFGIILLVRSSRKNQQMQEDEVGTALETAYNTRSKMDIRLKGNSHFVNGLCVGLSADGILIDINLPKEETSLIGLTTEVFFRIKNREKIKHYNFQAPIIRLVPYEKHFALELTRPDEMDNQQKRTFFRLSPKEGLITEAAFWYLPPDINLKLTSLKELQQTVCAGTVIVRDISGGGIRIGLTQAVPEVEEFKTGTTGILHIVSEELDLWFMGRLVSVHQVKTSKLLDISYKFSQWAKNPLDEELTFQWIPLESEDEGVAPLISWILRHHLESTHLGINLTH